MARRVQALVLLLVFGLLLPVAGAPRRYCLKAHNFVSQECCAPAGSCNDCPDEKAPLESSCVSIAKVVPDTLDPEPVFIPDFVFTIIEPLVAPPVVTRIPVPVASFLPERAPPDSGPPVYVRLRSLLI